MKADPDSPLYIARNRLNLKQVELGDLVELKQKQLGEIERGKYPLKKSLNLSLNYLLGQDIMRFNFSKETIEISGVRHEPGKYDDGSGLVTAKICFNYEKTFEFREYVTKDKILVKDGFLWDTDSKQHDLKLELLALCKGNKKVLSGVKFHIDQLINSAVSEPMAIAEAQKLLRENGYEFTGDNPYTGRYEAVRSGSEKEGYPFYLCFSSLNEMAFVLKKDGLADQLQKLHP